MATIAPAANHCLGPPCQTKLFYAKGLWWLFYTTGGVMKYATNSTSGCSDSSFNASVTVQSGGSDVASSYGWDFSVATDGNYVHYIYAPYNGSTMYYRRGLLNSNGTITWTSDNVSVGFSGLNSTMVSSSALDSSGNFIWAYRYGGGVAYVARNANTNGTFSLDSNYGTMGVRATQDAHNSSNIWSQVIPLTNNKWYVLSVGGKAPIYGRLWNGTALESTTDETCTYMDCSGYPRYTATNVGDDIYLLWNGQESQSPNYFNIYYAKRPSSTGTWSTTSTKLWTSDLANAVGYQPIPAVIKNTYLGKIYVGWLRGPTDNHFMYRTLDYGANTWSPLLSSGPTDGSSETSIEDATFLTSSQTSQNDNAVWAYPVGTSTYTVGTFAFASQGPPSNQSLGPCGGCAYGGVMIY